MRRSTAVSVSLYNTIVLPSLRGGILVSLAVNKLTWYYIIILININM